jgi:FixJ family two-component response regulator
VTNPPSLLLVDDEQSVLDDLRRQLRNRYPLVMANDGPQALEAIAAADEPFAVLVTDMRMPGMTGAELLERARELTPDTTRMLLTGQADIDVAIAAVNQGQLFRFLSKPCPPTVLVPAIEAAVRQNELVVSERSLLAETLQGSIQALVDTMALVSPAAFAQAERVRRIVGHVLDVLEVQDRWEAELAAMLAPLGVVTLPSTLVEKMHAGLVLNTAERTMAERVPEVSVKVLAGIPRLEGVRDAILAQSPRERAGRDLSFAAQVLLAATAADRTENLGGDYGAGIAGLRSGGQVATQIIDALEVAVAGRPDADSRPIAMDDLRPGMVLTADLMTQADVLLVGRGQKVSAAMLERLRNHTGQHRVKEPVWVREGAVV